MHTGTLNIDLAPPPRSELSSGVGSTVHHPNLLSTFALGLLGVGISSNRILELFWSIWLHDQYLDHLLALVVPSTIPTSSTPPHSALWV
jgi:hypothetical protein